MIGRLVGRIVEENADGTVVLDVRGVGYEVLVPLGALGRAAKSDDGLVTLLVHTHVREDAFLLYGFATREDRAAFRELIAVSNVGPKIALSVLGALSVQELATAIARGETQKLTRVPGIGKKTAERLALELKDKLTPLAEPLAGQPPRPSSQPTTPQAELLHNALTRLGFRPAEAERAVTTLGPRLNEAPLADLVREALAVLAK